MYINSGHTLIIMAYFNHYSLVAVCKDVFYTVSKQIFEPGKAWERGNIHYSPTCSFLYLSVLISATSYNSKPSLITSKCHLHNSCCCCSLQAKARELELRNHWAQAASTRRQTQMKYGFWWTSSLHKQVIHRMITFRINNVMWIVVQCNIKYRKLTNHVLQFNNSSKVLSMACSTASALSLVKQRGGLILMTLWSRPSFIRRILWFSITLQKRKRNRNYIKQEMLDLHIVTLFPGFSPSMNGSWVGPGNEAISSSLVPRLLRSRMRTLKLCSCVHFALRGAWERG